MSRLWFPWLPGPETTTDGPVLVSLTDYTMHSRRSLPGILRRGGRLGLGWYGLPGAIGLYLWADPLRGRTGSLSVWTDSDAMYRWVGLPLHVETMRHYRTRGTLRSTTWRSDDVDRRAILARANDILDTETGPVTVRQAPTSVSGDQNGDLPRP